MPSKKISKSKLPDKVTTEKRIAVDVEPEIYHQFTYICKKKDMDRSKMLRKYIKSTIEAFRVQFPESPIFNK